MNIIEKQLEEARKNLLDLTPRNRLLSFRSTKRRTLRVIDEMPKEVYDILVLKERSMEFLPKREKPDSDTNKESLQNNLFERSEEAYSDLSWEEAKILWKLPEPDAEVADRHRDRFLQTNLESFALQKRLFYIDQESRSVLEEQGYSILYLALGFLEWTESASSVESRRAPLILIPVELERASVRSSFKLRWTGEDILTNISLKAKLEEQSILLPEFEMPEDASGIDSYFESVYTAVSSMPKWNIVSDIYLDFFSFTKFVMYKDLDMKSWPEGISPEDYSLIKAIFAPSNVNETHDQGFSEEDIDEKLSLRQCYHVMDADPSQIKVIETVKSGYNLVVEGPPGTGKSQTITNIISELLGIGKSVLFVSEKMAALEVVKSRLDSLGLGDFCLELHSRKSNKREVLKELERRIKCSPPKPINLDDKFDHLEIFRSQLNDYARSLREPFGVPGFSPFRLYGIREKARRHFAEVERDMPRVRLADPENTDQKHLSVAKSALSAIVEILPLVRPITMNPWKGCYPGTILPSDEEDIDKLIDECMDTLNNLDMAIKRLVESCAVQTPRCLSDVDKSIGAARVIAASKPVDRSILLNVEWNKPSEQAEAIIERLELLETYITKVRSKFTDKALHSDINSILTEYKILSVKFLKFLKGRYRYLKREISSLYNESISKNDETKISDLEELAECISLRDQIRELEQTGRSLFGSHWQGENSDSKMLRDFSEWIVSYREQLLKEALTEGSIDIVGAGISREYVEKLIEELTQSVKSFEIRNNLLIKSVGADYKAIFGIESDEISFSDLNALFRRWKEGLPKLHAWAQFVARRKACLITIAGPLIELIESDAIEPEDLMPCFKGNLADHMLHLAFNQRPSLGNFIGDLHEKKIKGFTELDNELITENRKRLKYKVYKESPSISGGASPGSEVGILLGEINRKRRHMPIRKLILSCGRLIQKIKPCFMMSPLSIAQFLDPRNVSFDVIIFDEASQVKPEDALGALLRGKQLVVMGDTRQLPPTIFFDHIVQISDDEDEDQLTASVADMESILHLCKRSFSSKTLSWHYRSRHESLVAVSNQEFYDNQILIYPSPFDNSEHLGLKFIHIPEALYDRGRSSVNRKEAKRVAEAALEHYRKFPEKSLGVGTFNIKQQQAILEEIEFQLRQYPEMEGFFSSNREEHFFVKNLETIQGDERDVIFLSIGYGFDTNGRFSRNFGPLNHEGGHRRLNVLITRAREKCVVFSNFRAIDLSIDENSPFGLRALKTFLNYAESRTLGVIETYGEDTDSPFEDSVYDFLRSHGYEVRKQVGCAGFRVDLAIVDSNYAGRYLLGIECDGAKYHSSPVARDRDRLRQQILEGLGWRLYRIWSTDWYRNRREVEKKLLEAIEKAKYEEEPISVLSSKPNDCVNSERTTGDVVSEENSTKSDWLQKHFFGNPSNYTETHNIRNEVTLEDKIPEYKACSSLGISLQGEIHEQSPNKLARAVTRVVEIEGPIHFDEVVRRIRSLWRLKRAGERINKAVEEAAVLAEDNGNIKRRGVFLWSKTMRKAPVRKRSDDPPPKIDLICDEEISEAIKLVLKHQHGTLPDELIVQTSRLLGIQATRSEAFDRISSVIEKLKVEELLQQMPNGMIDFTNP